MMTKQLPQTNGTAHLLIINNKTKSTFKRDVPYNRDSNMILIFNPYSRKRVWVDLQKESYWVRCFYDGLYTLKQFKLSNKAYSYPDDDACNLRERQVFNSFLN